MIMDVESMDLAELGSFLREVCGAFVEGVVVGRTRMRDEVARRHGCSLLEAEELVDTMIVRGFIGDESRADGRKGWTIHAPRSPSTNVSRSRV
jgi:hypothetical protein